MLICDISTTHKYGKLALDLLLAPHQLCWQEMVVLMVFDETPEAPQSLLSLMLQTDKGNVTRLLTRMEEKGLLIRDINQQDNRRRNNTLSPKGARLIPTLHQVLDTWEAACFSGLTLEEQRIFFKASQTIIRNTMDLVKDPSQEETP